ncbi:hypothetical protein B0T21DRAFT_455797 [Apiosordaria backusii]|uniref:Aminoglycoside phosphotransferase domain-containing protein n=1 Tax=Apiosordaria backusii TaxID=314023 RepID=A0AA39ZPY6_9PEZI|nr:hypothetical protein B0T21DRAFT_455797 [Apiosordaria backusii]
MSIDSCPVRESIREINDKSWVIGGRILLSRQSLPPSSGTFWGDGTGSFYTITDAPHPPSEYLPLPATSHPFEKVYDVGDAHATWIIGEAALKVQLVPKEIPSVTREHVTINEVKKRSFSFAIPEVYHHAEFEGRYYIFLSKIHGETLSQAWPKMGETAKQNCVARVVSIIKELMVWRGPNISGVDGGYLPDRYLARRGPREEKDWSPSELLRCCQELGMDCSTFVFHHLDLGPGNIFVNDTFEINAIIDWECAGFIPIDWIRTKFTMCPGLDLDDFDWEYLDKRVEYRWRVATELANEGFDQVTKKWFSWAGIPMNN